MYICKERNTPDTDSWDKYMSKIEHGLHGNQNTAYIVVNHLNKTERETEEIQNIKIEDWDFNNLWNISKTIYSSIV